jgi:hypothetical protein
MSWHRPVVKLVELDVAGTAGDRSVGKETHLGAPYAGKYAMPEFAEKMEKYEQKHGKGMLVFSSVFRSAQKQADLLYLRAQGVVVATPGRSLHQFGLAADLNRTETLKRHGISMEGYNSGMGYPNKPIEELDKLLAEFGIYRISSESWHKQNVASGRQWVAENMGPLMQPDDAGMAEVFNLYNLHYPKKNDIKIFQKMFHLSQDGAVYPEGGKWSETRYAAYYAGIDYQVVG